MGFGHVGTQQFFADFAGRAKGFRRDFPKFWHSEVPIMATDRGKGSHPCTRGQLHLMATYLIHSALLLNIFWIIRVVSPK